MPRARSVKINVIANYIGQAYATFIGIIVFPLYLQYLGAEAYGLVGFFVVLQTWLGMLDIGMSPMLNREMAAARARAEKLATFRLFLRSIEIIFMGISVAVALTIYLSRDWISLHWLRVETLDIREVAQCVGLMGTMVGLRFFTTIYRSGLTGLEGQVVLNSLSVFFATLRSFGALAVLSWIGTAPLDFFLYQFVVAVLEPLVTGTLFYKRLPQPPLSKWLSFSWKLLRPTLPFALGSAHAAVTCIISTQLDKLLLSNILPLHEYGYFAIAASISSGVAQLSNPIGNAILPRMAFLLSSGNEPAIRDLYRKATQVVAAIMFSVTTAVAFWGTELIYAWTGNHTAANWAGPILFWYMMGNMFFSLASFHYCIQFAHGNLRLHVKVNTLLFLITAPLISFAAYRYGPLGTGFCWFIIQLLCFIGWPLVVHRKFAPGLHKTWLLKDILPIAAGTAVGLFLATRLPREALANLSRPVLFASLFGLGLIVLACAVAGSSYLRQIGFRLLKKIKEAFT